MEDAYGDSTASGVLDASGFLKRKRSDSPERIPPAKITKTQPGANIDFLASVQAEALPLVDTEDSLRFIQQHFEAYSGVIERHESLAANLGAKLQAPNSIKRFERMFFNDIKILANHGKDGNTVTWLDIVKFYDDKPSMFKLVQKDGQKVCQFYTKQCRVEINEDDFQFIREGQPQKMLPSGTVPADEEKELGTIEFMETKIGQIIKLADQVSGRGKQLMSRLKARRNALAAKRDAEVNGGQPEGSPSENRSGSPTSGFTAVNAHRDVTMTNGGVTTTSTYNKPLVSQGVKTELQAIFAITRDRSLSGSGEYAIRSAKSRNRVSDYGYADALLNTASPAQQAPAGAPSTPAGAGAGASAGSARQPPVEKSDNDGPFKVEMLARMEKMNRYTIVRPPCDRCRRLQMDCQKNLTACLGCTKKHAKCSWKEVTKQELIDNPAPQASAQPTDHIRHGSMSDSEGTPGGSRTPVPVLDRELLGDDDSDDEADPHLARNSSPAACGPAYTDGTNDQTAFGESPTRARGASSLPGSALPQPDANMSSAASVQSLPPPTPFSPSRSESASKKAATQPSPSSKYDRDFASSSHDGDATSAAALALAGSDHSTKDHHSDHIKVEQLTQNGQQQAQHQRIPSFPSILGDRMIDNPAVLGTATGDRLAREAQNEIDRLQPDATGQRQQASSAGMNGTMAA